MRAYTASMFGLRVSACAAAAILALAALARAQPAPLHLLPQPRSVAAAQCSAALVPMHALHTASDTDPGGVAIVNERWRALGLAPLRTRGPSDITFSPMHGVRGAYRLRVSDGPKIAIAAADGDGRFNALATLAQLPQRGAHGYGLPCVAIDDAPALKWRILSDDVSRGPLPTMHYFKERIRTIAAFKMNGYSPYMENVFADPKHPLPAPPDGITPAQLSELDRYARRFHVSFIPEQQTFAHMHNTLRWERYAAAAELPHGYLMSPVNPLTYSYLSDLLGDELAAVPHPVFFHIGSDEPSDLGRGQSKAAVEARGDAAVYADHVRRIAQIVSASGARPMIWDDAIQRHPDILLTLPKSLVIVNWHYGAEKTFMPYIRTIASRGFDQMVAPGANNWNEIYPDIDVALKNQARFIYEGQQAHVLGLFQTVWHDDGESLYEATWYPVIFSAAAAWHSGLLAPAAFAADFPWAFFASADTRLGDDIGRLGAARDLLRSPDGEDSGDYLFWSDPFDPRIQARIAKSVDLAAVRLEVEPVIEHLLTAPAPPMHANAALVMKLAARRYDALARFFQIGAESRYYYDDARAHADGKHESLVYRGLFISKYLLWEMRDDLLAIEPMYRAAWLYESRLGHLPSVLERYHLAAQRAIARADAIDAATREGYLRFHKLPTFDDVLGLHAAP